ncbi:MAG TPA: LysR family transcriptional regulator [Dongiaceae bacterium]|jgi:DNA-binding transcriptional LysR family regulator|nr:LysR family transcriptional regulator [Dongiaceae bacterium]
MKEDWDDLRIFLALARQGKLSAVAKELGVSHPTVARRVKKLEATVGARLFDRLPDRFVLTAAGEGLLGDAEAMEEAAASIHRRSAGMTDAVHGTVRISAGEAMTNFLARNMPRLRHNLNCIEFELAKSHMLANLSRREADLIIREQVPDLASIVARKLGDAAYAIYAAPEVEVRGGRDALKRMTWIGFDEEHAYMPGQAWLHALLDGKRPAIRSNDWQVVQEATRAGAGLAVLPCYLADGDPGLRRIGAPLREVVAEQWLLVHRDLRGLPRVRAVMDAIIRLFHDERALLEGRAAGRRGVRPALRAVAS